MIEVRRKDNESLESMLRRFNKRMVQSGTLGSARKKRYFERNKSKLIQKETAIRKKHIKERREYLKKIGKIGLSRYRLQMRARVVPATSKPTAEPTASAAPKQE